MALAAGSAAAAAAPAPGSFAALAARVDLSYVRSLTEDPEAADHIPNQEPREVRSGHYVRVAPTPLRAPYLIAVSADYARVLGLDPAEAATESFLRVFSGDLAGAPPNFESRGWATPYALSIYGRPQLPPGTGPRGDGYGDGRAISIAEVVLPEHGADGGGGGTGGGVGGAPLRAELQLKGGGRTPFCRGADGAAVLRSSVREFIASEANAAMGVPTTRALCLVASAVDTVVRPWYSPQARGGEPDILVSNRRAITTRAARSFLRVGQFELYGRRAARGEPAGLRDLEALTRHALEREYPALAPAPGAPLGPAVVAMLRAASARFAELAAAWLRVGYVQSNFNGDNCLVGGATLDYGPFGFLERYDAEWGMWVGTGLHFAFGNQPNAMAMNFAVLVQSLLPLLGGDAALREEARAVFEAHSSVTNAALAVMWASKLGLPATAAAAASGLWESLEPLLAGHPTDWTLFWRQLALLAPPPPPEGAAAVAVDLAPLEPAWYAPLPAAAEPAWRAWVAQWHAALHAAGVSGPAAAAAMRAASPKYVPREWMLAAAYSAAEAGDAGPVLELLEIFRRPFDEQPGAEARFYRRQPDGTAERGGLGRM